MRFPDYRLAMAEVQNKSAGRWADYQNWNAALGAEKGVFPPWLG
jgi:hypothetical protein